MQSGTLHITQTDQPVQLIRAGKPFFDKLLQLIRQATQSIQLQTYILDDDETGLMVTDALEAAAARGVQVSILADGYGSRVLQQKTISSMRSAGIRFRFFEPLFRSRHFYFGRRLHHKLFVADQRYALVGGINITNRYNDMPGKPAWLDYALLVTGEPAEKTGRICTQLWNGDQGPYVHDLKKTEPGSISVKRNDWVRHYNEISGTYIDMLRHAQREVTIACSYFLPGRVIRRLLRAARTRGVRIRVITAGPSDVMVAKHAERWMYDWLLRYGIQLYEYQPAVLHAKVAVCDNEWFTLGSYNINNISAYASIELNLEVRDKATAMVLEDDLERMIQQDCRQVTAADMRKSRNPLIRLRRWFSYFFIRAVFRLMTFYFKRRS